MLEPAPIEAIEVQLAGHFIFVAVTTEGGRRGYGEATYFVHPQAVAPIAADLEEAYLGQDAYRPEFLYQRVLKKHCMIDAASMSVMSAIDQALWDIKAKDLDMPVWQLLGGRVRDKVKAILLIEATDAEEIVAKSKAAVEEGFKAIKIKPFIGDWSEQSSARLMKTVVETVEWVRDAIGWDVDLAVEVHRNLAPEQAIVFADQARRYGLYFIEDPIQPFSISVNRHVARGLRTPVALAERNINIWEFRDFSDEPAVTILRPDAGLAGGFTQMRKIAAIAESRHQRILPHNFTSPLLTAVHVQCAAAIHNWDLQGYVREDSASRNQVVKDVNKIEDGYLQIPETPGVGIELDWDFICGADYVPFGSKYGHIAFMASDGAVKQQ